MADNRIGLYEELCKVLDMTEPDGDRHVYFQPPQDLLMKYPAIVYSLKNIESEFADNALFFMNDSYKVTLIAKDPDNEYIRKILHIPNCSFDTSFTADNLNHYVYTIYY